MLTQPATLNAYTYALNNPLRYTDPSGEFIESPLDIAFILFDTASIGIDLGRIALNKCSLFEDDLQRQLLIDAGALALDLVFLALPGATGGGMGLRMAFAGANATYDVMHAASVLKAGIRIIQPVVKGVQAGG